MFVRGQVAGGWVCVGRTCQNTQASLVPAEAIERAVVGRRASWFNEAIQVVILHSRKGKPTQKEPEVMNPWKVDKIINASCLRSIF